MAVYVVQKDRGFINEEIGRLFGGLHYSAVSKAEGRVSQAMATDRELVKIVRKLDSNFKS